MGASPGGDFPLQVAIVGLLQTAEASILFVSETLHDAFTRQANAKLSVLTVKSSLSPADDRVAPSFSTKLNNLSFVTIVSGSGECQSRCLLE
jgi:hypothetical protein